MKDTNLKITSQLPFCPNSLSLDLYRGCPHVCAYCFVQTMNNNTFKFGNKSNIIEPRDFTKVLKIIKSGNTSKRFIFCSKLIKKRQPLHIGGMSDPFPFQVELKMQHTKQFMQQIGDYPCIWSSKNPMPEYSNEFENGNHIFQFSTIGDHELSSKIEAGLLPFGKRFQNLKDLKPYVKKVVMRLQPFIPCLWNNDKLTMFFDKIANHINAITIEFLKKPFNEKWENLGSILGFNIGKEYNSLKSEGKDKVLDEEYRYKTLIFIKKLCKERGIEFFCADNRFRDMGSGYNCCGVGVNDSDVFQSKIPFCFNRLLFQAKNAKSKSFSMSDIESVMDNDIKELTLASVSIVSVYKNKTILEFFNEKYNNGFPSKFFKHLTKGAHNHYVYDNAERLKQKSLFGNNNFNNALYSYRKFN